MRKTDKKIDKQLISILTDVCEQTLKKVNGFQWLTHRVNYDNFPMSLQIVLVFNTKTNQTQFVESPNKVVINQLILQKLKTLNISFKNINQHIIYDNEESCHQTHNGNWANKLSLH